MRTDPRRSDIELMEQREAAAMLAADITALDAIWDDQLLAYSTANVYARKPILLEIIRNGRLRLRSHQRRTIEVTFEGPIAIAIGNERSDMIGVAERLACSYMNVWVQRSGEWKLLARYVGRLPADTIPPPSA